MVVRRFRIIRTIISLRQNKRYTLSCTRPERRITARGVGVPHLWAVFYSIKSTLYLGTQWRILAGYFFKKNLLRVLYLYSIISHGDSKRGARTTDKRSGIVCALQHRFRHRCISRLAIWSERNILYQLDTSSRRENRSGCHLNIISVYMLHRFRQLVPLRSPTYSLCLSKRSLPARLDLHKIRK